MSREALLAAHWFHGPQPISNQPVGLGFPHLPGRRRTGRSAFSSPGCWSCGDIEGFLYRGWEIILPGCSGTSALSRGATLDARDGSMSLSQLEPSSWVGVSTPCGAVLARVICIFFPGLLKLYRYGRISNPGIGNYPLRGRRDFGVGPRGNSRGAEAR